MKRGETNGEKELSGRARTEDLSALFVILGLVFLHWSQALFFVGGNALRLGSLGLGFILIVLAAWLRSRNRVFRYAPFFLVTGSYFAALAMLTLIQKHEFWDDPVQKVFFIICIGLFWSGYLLASEKRRPFGSPQQWSLVAVALVACACLISFIRYVKIVSSTASGRGIGDTALNANGVAFSIGCLALIFFVIGFLNDSLWRKWMFIFVGVLALFVISTTASRGAILWGVLSLLFMAFINRHRKRLSLRNILGPVFSALFISLVVVFLYKSNYLVDERLELLVRRFTSMFEHFESTSNDASMDERIYVWDNYFRTWHEWIVFGEKHQQSYPHNQWLEIFVKFGFFGLPLFVMSIFLAGRLCLTALESRLRPDVEFSLIVTLFVFSYLQSMTSLSLQMNRTLWLGFGYLLGFYVEKAQYRRFQNRRRSPGVDRFQPVEPDRERVVARSP